MGAVVASMSKAYPGVSGVLLTGGFRPSTAVLRLLDGMRNMSVPVLAVKTNTYETLIALKMLRDRIDPDDTRKVHTALGNFDRYVNSEELATRIVENSVSRMTPRMFEYKLMDQARKHPMRIVLPEGDEERILRAAEALAARETAQIILLGKPELIQEKAKTLSISLVGTTIIDPANSPKLEEYADLIGLAFQIKDDILDIEGDFEKLGKSIGSDTELEKSTYPALIGLEESKKLLDEIVEKAKTIIIENFSEERGKILIELADFIGKRDN